MLTSISTTTKLQQSTSQRLRHRKRNNDISSREHEVLVLIAFEYSSKEIAAKLHISSETVTSHRKNIMLKLGVKNTAGMVRVAFEKSLLKMKNTQI